MDSTERLLKELTEITGISGYERDVAKAIEKHLKPIAKISYDRLGSMICRKDGAAKAPRVMLAAHMDEVGFLVKQVTKEGFIKFLPIGGWFSQVILGQRVVIRTRKGDVVGVVGSKPPHELEDEERKKVVRDKGHAHRRRRRPWLRRREEPGREAGRPDSSLEPLS